MTKRDKNFLFILWTAVLLSFVSHLSLALVLRNRLRSMRSDLSIATKSCDLSRSYCSSIVEFVSLYSPPSSQTPSIDNPQDSDTGESEFDVVGVYGYGQTKSRDHVWIYRDDRLRNGQSRRVYLRKFPVSKDS